MNDNKKFKILWAVIGILLVLNIGIILWITLLPPRHPLPQNQPAVLFLEKELGFNDKQKESYRILREGHFEQINAIQQELRKMKEAFFDLLKNPEPSELEVEELSKQIAQKTSDIDKNTFRHFQQVRKLCTADQQTKFDKIIGEVLKRMGRPGHPNRPGDGPPPPRE